MSEPTRDQICAYLQVTGWDVDSVGSVKTCWVRRGKSVFVRHETSGEDLEDLIFKISMAEGRHPADVRDDILDVDNPIHAKVAAWAASLACENAAAAVRRRIADVGDDGWPGIRNWHDAEAMQEQAVALATVLDRTAALIKSASEVDPAYPWHPLWIAACRAAEVIALAEPAKPDDLEALKRRQEAMRAGAMESDS